MQIKKLYMDQDKTLELNLNNRLQRSSDQSSLPNLSFLQAFYLSDVSAAFWPQVSKASLGA